MFRHKVNADYDSKKRKGKFQPKWLINFKRLRQELDKENSLEGEAKGTVLYVENFQIMQINSKVFSKE